MLGEIREIVFGAQDGLVSTLAVVAAVAAATNNRLAVLIAGLASAVAGIFSMAAGEYLGSKSQAEIFDAEIANEREEVADRPAEAGAELAFLFAEEELPEAEAGQVAAIPARHPTSMLSTMVFKELGLIYAEQFDTNGGPLREALVMGGVFAVGGLVPILPFLISGGMPALLWSAGLTGAALFGLGAIKSRYPSLLDRLRCQGVQPGRLRRHRWLPLRFGPAGVARLRGPLIRSPRRSLRTRPDPCGSMEPGSIGPTVGRSRLRCKRREPREAVPNVARRR